MITAKQKNKAGGSGRRRCSRRGSQGKLLWGGGIERRWMKWRTWSSKCQGEEHSRQRNSQCKGFVLLRGRDLSLWSRMCAPLFYTFSFDLALQFYSGVNATGCAFSLSLSFWLVKSPNRTAPLLPSPAGLETDKPSSVARQLICL